MDGFAKTGMLDVEIFLYRTIYAVVI